MFDFTASTSAIITTNASTNQVILSVLSEKDPASLCRILDQASRLDLIPNRVWVEELDDGQYESKLIFIQPGTQQITTLISRLEGLFCINSVAVTNN